MESLSLKVEETREYGMGHKYAHIEYPNALNASMGDVLELISIYGWRRRTVAKYWGRVSRDVGKGIIQIERLVSWGCVFSYSMDAGASVYPRRD